MNLALQRAKDAMLAAKWEGSEGEDRHGAVACMLADLMHWCDAEGVDFPEAVRQAGAMYTEDKLAEVVFGPTEQA